MKEFGTQMDRQYKERKESINDFYFKRAVGAAIIFNTVDGIVARAPWYQKGGPKLNIVPYTISKIMTSLPDGYEIDWQRIWQRQSLQPQFVHEIEIVAKMANDFIMKSSGVIVTEYCKKAETWEKFKAVPYTPSVEFMKTLISAEEQQSDERAAYKAEKEQSQLAVEVQVFQLGSAYWQRLHDEAEKMKVLTYKDSSLLKVAASVENTGKIPSPAQARAIMAIKERLEKEGIFV